jgi:hypothetical protein
MLLLVHLPGWIDIDGPAHCEFLRCQSKRHACERMADRKIGIVGETLDEILCPQFESVWSSGARAMTAQVGSDHSVAAFCESRANPVPVLMVCKQTMDQERNAVACTPFVHVQFHSISSFSD